MMGYAKSAMLTGIDSRLIDVEVDISNGMPYFELVGYLSSESKEAKERVRSAIRNSNIELSPKKVIINLSPADIRKAGTGYDLAIALAVLSAYRYVHYEQLNNMIIIGELGLNGMIKPVAGVLAMILEAYEKGYRRCMIPYDNLSEACVLEDMEIIAVSHLNEALKHLKGLSSHAYKKTEQVSKYEEDCSTIDFSDIKGQAFLKRSIMIAVAGMHHILMIGPPGSAKSMAAMRIPTIMPDLTYEESIELSKIYSAAGLLKNGLLKNRPFRMPHHSTTFTAMLGGGIRPRPGEISLAHNGVLFLDELSEYQIRTIEALRQSLENHSIMLSRLEEQYEFPANYILVGAMNPCKCGYYPDHNKCFCTPLQIQRYFGKLSQPFLDRIDIHVEVKGMEEDIIDQLEQPFIESESALMKKQVEIAHEIQAIRYAQKKYHFNSQMTENDIRTYCHLEKEERVYMKDVYKYYMLSPRNYLKILKVARTIADLERSEKIKIEHLSEAVMYKTIDKQYWTGLYGTN